MEDKFEGGISQIAGRVQDTVGAATGDPGMQLEGKARQVAGRVQQSYGDVVESVRSQASDNPFVAIAIATSVGFILGALWSGRD